MVMLQIRLDIGFMRTNLLTQVVLKRTSSTKTMLSHRNIKPLAIFVSILKVMSYKFSQIRGKTCSSTSEENAKSIVMAFGTKG